MSILLNGSLDLTLILEKAKGKHSAFSKSEKNGHIYFNITQWINDEPNEFGQHSSLLLNSSKEGKETEGKVYIGNAKKVEGQQGAAPVSSKDAEELPAADDLPF